MVGRPGVIGEVNTYIRMFSLKLTNVVLDGIECVVPDYKLKCDWAPRFRFSTSTFSRGK